MKISIYDDLYDICNRLKEIDDHYFVVFDTKKQKFELHHSKQKNGSYLLTFPYDELDARAIEFTRETRIERKDAFIRELNRRNRKMEKEEKYTQRKKIEAYNENFLGRVTDKKPFPED